MSLHQKIMDLYDAEVARHPEGIKTADAKAAIHPAVMDLMIAEPRDVAREAESATRTVDRDRDARSRAVKRDLEYILDYFMDPSEAALVPDSRMDFAIRLGEKDGTDKTLRFWTAEDFIAMGQLRTANAELALTAAKDLNEVIGRVVGRMRRAGVSHFGDVSWGSPA